jgi:pimeloyl-ACP methyl ester carboxylesterase
MPYVLTAVGHSLGGAELLMYTVMQLRRREPHRLARLVLLTPAGFVAKVPIGLRPIAWVLPTIIWLFRRFTRDGLCVPFIIPTAWARRLVFGLSADIKAVPELNTLLKWVSGAH